MPNKILPLLNLVFSEKFLFRDLTPEDFFFFFLIKKDHERLDIQKFPVQDLTPEAFLSPWQRRLCFWQHWFVCLSVNNITQNVMNGLGRNFMEGSWVVQ